MGEQNIHFISVLKKKLSVILLGKATSKNDIIAIFTISQFFKYAQFFKYIQGKRYLFQQPTPQNQPRIKLKVKLFFPVIFFFFWTPLTISILKLEIK